MAASAESLERAPGGGAPSLDTCTQFNGSGFACTFRDFGDGGVEITGCWVDGDGVRRTPRTPRGERVVVDGVPWARSESSIQRARVNLRRKCRALGADRILTLTSRDLLETRQECAKAFHRFNVSMSRLYGARWQYVAIFEQHKSGMWHIHVALKGYWWVGTMRRLWSRALGGTGRESKSDTFGNVDVACDRGERATVRRVASYLGKYFAKSAHHCARGERLVNSSGGISTCLVSRWREPFSLGMCPTSNVIRWRLCGRGNLEGLRVAWWRYGGSHGFTINTA